jgi:hypothetical protein
MSEQENHLVEGPHIPEWQCSYMVKLNELRSEGGGGVGDFSYLDKTWIVNNLTFKKCYHTGGVK